MIVMQEFGRNPRRRPYFETIVSRASDRGRRFPEQRQSSCPKIMEGEAIWALALGGGTVSYDLHNRHHHRAPPGGQICF